MSLTFPPHFAWVSPEIRESSSTYIYRSMTRDAHVAPNGSDKRGWRRGRKILNYRMEKKQNDVCLFAEQNVFRSTKSQRTKSKLFLFRYLEICSSQQQGFAESAKVGNQE